MVKGNFSLMVIDNSYTTDNSIRNKTEYKEKHHGGQKSVFIKMRPFTFLRESSQFQVNTFFRQNDPNELILLNCVF